MATRISLILVLIPMLAFGEGSETVKMGTSTHNVQSPLIFNWIGSTHHFGGATVDGLAGGGGTPGGSNTWVQFNDSGAFGGDSGLVFNKTTDVLSVGGELSINALTLKNVANQLTFQWDNSNAVAAFNIWNFATGTPDGGGAGIDIETDINGFSLQVPSTSATHTDTQLLNWGPNDLGLYSSADIVLHPSGSVKVANMTTNGFVKTGSSDGTLSVDTATYLTGNQSISLTGDVTGSGTTTIATTIPANSIALADMATIATDSILGRATASTGNVEVLSSLPFAATGDVTRPADSNAYTLATVNSNVGSFTNANVTVNGKGLITAASNGTGGSGTVTSVGLAGTSNQITVTGTSPITSSGSFTLSVPTSAQLNVAKLTNLTTNGFVTTSGSDGTLGIDTSTYLTSSSAASTYQPLDSDLTTIAGLTATTDNFMIGTASAWSSRTPAQARTSLALVIGANVQAWDTDLDTWATKTPYAGTVVVTTGKTFTDTNNLTLSGTDGSTLNIGTGGTLGSNAFNSTAFGTGTVTNTGGNLTSNAVVLGAGTVDTKVSTGITTNGASQLNLGVDSLTQGVIQLYGVTSGSIFLQAQSIAGAATIKLPNANSTLPVYPFQITYTGPTTTRTKTIRDANDTYLELGGSYTPTGTWTSLTMVTPVLGTPTSGNLANCTFPTLNQNTSGSAATLTTARNLWGQSFNGSAAVGGAIELGTAGTTDTTLDRTAAGRVTVEGNEVEITRPHTTTSATSWTPDFDTYTQEAQTALAGNITAVNAPTWTTAADARKRILRIKANGSGPYTIGGWNAIYRVIGTTLPLSIAASKTIYIGLIYNVLDTKWDVVAVQIEP